jgi:hypothetical protein
MPTFPSLVVEVSWSFSSRLRWAHILLSILTHYVRIFQYNRVCYSIFIEPNTHTILHYTWLS